MHRLIDLVGDEYGLLRVIQYAGRKRWLCQCQCGCLSIAYGWGLRSGRATSCGCSTPPPPSSMAAAARTNKASDEKQILSRFWSKVNKTQSCWLWIGSQSTSGYGIFSIRGKNHLAHRYSYALVNGEIEPGKHICHKCDTPLCINPDHLFPGTPMENAMDRVSKGRGVIGEAVHFAKTTAAVASAIKLDYENTPNSGSRKPMGTIDKLAAKYKVSKSCVSLIVYEQNWKHVS